MKKIFSLLLVLLLFTVLIGCGGGSNDRVSQENVSLYFMLRGISNEFWTTMKDAIEGQAKIDGIDVYVELLSSDDDISGQIEKLSTAIAGGSYQGIGAAPVTGTDIIECVIAANEKGIPFCNVDDRINADELKKAGGWITSYAGTDNRAIGEMAAKYIMETLGSDTTGTILVLEGATGSSAGEARRDGAISVFQSFDSITLISQPGQWDKNLAYDVSTNIMTQYADLKAIYCANDTMALGAVEAVENAGRLGQIVIVGTDGIPDALEAVKQGRLNATCKQDPAAIGLACYRMLLDSVQKGNKGSLDGEVTTEFASALLITE
jgi:D-allose transport system substrate-binding protein